MPLCVSPSSATLNRKPQAVAVTLTVTVRDLQTAMRSPSSGSHYDDGYADKVQTSPSRTRHKPFNSTQVGVNSISFGAPHVLPMWALSTCGA